jgi:glutaredoxin 3
MDYEQKGIAFQYVDVTRDPAGMKKMLQYSKGEREVPVVVDGGRVTIGYAGGS